MFSAYLDSIGNIDCIDTDFFGFPRYASAYLVRAERNALIDTGAPKSIASVRNRLERLGVSMKDISYIFVTHTEHPDHSGNVGELILENPETVVVCHPDFVKYLTNPEIEAAERERILPPGMAERFGKMTAVDRSRIKPAADGQVYELGDGEALKVIYAPGHQPSGIVIEEKKNNGLFINDLAGQYFAEFDMSLILTPSGADPALAMDSLSKLNTDYEWFFLGHYGISDNPSMIKQRAMDKMRQLMDMAKSLYEEGRAEALRNEILERVVMPEISKLQVSSDKSLYQYYLNELGPNLANGFAKFYKEYQKKGGS